MIAVSAISDIGDKILLSNGEEICYTKRKKKALREELQKKKELMIAKISKKKLPLDKMIGNSFSSLFSNMDAKWLHVYERATLYGETLEIMDYSPEIDTNLKIICFPTFPGHCGCILFNADQMKSISEENHLVRLAAVSMKTPVYNFINDRLVDESAVLRPLSWLLILYVFRYFSRKWQKISDCECPDLIQNETPVRFLYGTQKNVRSDRAESSWHSN